MFLYELFAFAMLASSGLAHSDKISSNSTVKFHEIKNSTKSSYIELVDISVSVEEAEDDHIPVWDNLEALKLEALEKQMSMSFEALRSYILWTKFDVSGFYDAAATIGMDISMLAEEIGTVEGHKEIRAQYQFLAQMFETMVEAAQYTEETVPSRSRASLLVRNVIELNVRLLVLYDPFGVPDYQSQGYAYKVSRLKRLLKEWKNEFASLKNTSDELSGLFMVHTSPATDSLKQLQNHILLQWFTS
ncbi:hypothetical protein METSCH_D06530 [Metschnikowia aff. pulcherrima]|uniref:Uncharacterized protein n=1 Tax=Metschnikowia aff. pulcherrima TaxID=2163413 RepID=A0A4P6XS28_9ASCO|nr:hypothetical protein METSCH_D06530 [Metschnikowia aff. pulcherrima]